MCHGGGALLELMSQTNVINTPTLEAIPHVVSFSFSRTLKIIKTQTHRILSANWAKNVI